MEVSRRRYAVRSLKMRAGRFGLRELGMDTDLTRASLAGLSLTGGDSAGQHGLSKRLARRIGHILVREQMSKMMARSAALHFCGHLAETSAARAASVRLTAARLASSISKTMTSIRRIGNGTLAHQQIKLSCAS